MDTSEDSISVQYTIDDQPTSQAVVNGVSVVSNSEPTSIPPLYNVIDPDVLNTLSIELENGIIRFDYAGYQVTVKDNNSVTITPD